MRSGYFILRSLFICHFVIAAAVAAPQSKQDKPDLSGAWLLDTKKSNSSGLTMRPDLPIKIVHNDPEFRLTLTTERQGQLTERAFLYFTDGRGETNAATSILTTNPGSLRPDDFGETKSKTKWSGAKIVTRSLLRLGVPGRSAEFEQIEEWKLSTDGKVLTHTSKTIFLRSDGAFVSGMARDKKRVYNRV